MRPGEEYELRFERQESRVRLFVGPGEEPAAEFDDWDTPSSPGNQVLGFSTWGKVGIGRVEVLRAALPLRASPIEFAEYLRSRAQYSEAVTLLDGLLRDSKDEREVERALDAFYGAIDNAVACAAAYIHCHVAGEYTFSAGSDDSIMVRINGKEVWRNRVRRGAGPDQDQFRAELREGWNEVLLKVANLKSKWGFYFRVLDPDSALDFSLRARDTPPARQ